MSAWWALTTGCHYWQKRWIESERFIPLLLLEFSLKHLWEGRHVTETPDAQKTGRTPKKTLQNVQRWHAWTSGPHQRALWPEQTSEQQRSALIRTHCPAPHALWELYSTGGACHTAVLLSCYSLWYCNVILISVRWHLYSKCSCLDTDTDEWTAFKTQILFEYVQF